MVNGGHQGLRFDSLLKVVNNLLEEIRAMKTAVATSHASITHLSHRTMLLKWVSNDRKMAQCAADDYTHSCI